MSFSRKGTNLILGKFVNRVNAAAEMTRREIYGVLEETREPVPSEPGAPPARRTGRLMESIAVTKRASRTDLSAEVGPRVESFRDQPYYPRFLEFGTRKMAPRPFMRPGIERAKKARF